MKTATGSSQLQSLQILRAIAATSVVYFHTFMTPHFGSFGVELFFVLSGLVISMVAESRVSWVDFLSARITRIAPAYWILTTLQLVVAAARPGLLNSTTAGAGNYLKSIFFIPYFKENGSLTPVLPVGWTLNYEMLFYVLAAVSIAVAARKSFSIVTAALVVIAWMLGHLLPPTTAAGAFLRSDEVFYFLLGMVAWKCRDLAFLQAIPALVALGIVTLFYAAMAWFEVAQTTGQSLARIPALAAYGIPSFFVVLLAMRLESSLRYVNDSVVAVLSHIGDASYATYLSHLFVIEFIRKILAPRFPGIAPNTVVGAVLAIVASLLAGSVIYALIDKPAVKYARNFIKCHLHRGLPRTQ